MPSSSRECLEKIQENKYENVSLWAKNNFDGWYMVQTTTPNGLHVHWLTKTDWVPQERFVAYLDRNVLETFESDNTFDIVIE